MKLEEKILLTVQYRPLEQATLTKHGQDWLTFARVLYQPTYCLSDTQVLQPFQLGEVQKILSQCAGVLA